MLNTRTEDGIIIAEFAGSKFNSITLDTLKQLREAVQKANSDAAVKGIVLTGQGKVFSSGFDLPTFMGFKDHAAVVDFFTSWAEPVFMEFFMCSKPVVAAINGAAMAGGLILATACDYRIAKNHPKIQIGMTEIKIGLGLSVVQSEIMQFGWDSAVRFRDIMYNGDRYTVDQALKLGMVDELAEEAALMSRAKEIVAKWYDNPGKAFGMLKKGLRQPVADRMKHYLENSNWQDGFKCFFNPETRGAIDFVMKMMG